MGEVEYQPLSDDAKAAINEARFKTANVAHTWAIIYDERRELFDRIGIGATPYLRAVGGKMDFEARTGNPEIIALCSGAA